MSFLQWIGAVGSVVRDRCPRGAVVGSAAEDNVTLSARIPKVERNGRIIGRGPAATRSRDPDPATRRRHHAAARVAELPAPLDRRARLGDRLEHHAWSRCTSRCTASRVLRSRSARSASSSWCPLVAVTVLGSPLVDRIDRRRLLIVAQTGQAVASVLLLAVTLAGHPHVARRLRSAPRRSPGCRASRSRFAPRSPRTSCPRCAAARPRSR